MTAVLIVANRGCYLSYVVSETIGMSYVTYLNQVYTRPLVSAIPAFLISMALKNTLLPGNGLFQLATALAVAAIANYSVVLFTCTEPDHRSAIFAEVASLAHSLLKNRVADSTEGG